MQNPFHNAAEEKFLASENNQFLERLAEKYRPKPYFEQFAGLRLVSLSASYLFNAFSGFTASTLVFTFVFALSGYIIAAIATLASIVLLEIAKRQTTGPLFREWWTRRHISPGLMATVILLIGLSVAGSFFGSKEVVRTFTPPAEVVDQDSASAPIQAQIAAIDQQIGKARETRWKGTTTSESQRTIKKLTDQRAGLVDELNRTRSKVDTDNSSIAIEHREMLNLNASSFAMVTLLLEFLFLLCLAYLEYFDYRSYLEALAVAQAAKEAEKAAQAEAQAAAATRKQELQPAKKEESAQRIVKEVTGENLNGVKINGNHIAKNTADQENPHDHTMHDNQSQERRQVGFFWYPTQDHALCAEKEERIFGEKKQIVKGCDYCGQSYFARTTWQRFCSGKCRDTYHSSRGNAVARRINSHKN